MTLGVAHFFLLKIIIPDQWMSCSNTEHNICNMQEQQGFSAQGSISVRTATVPTNMFLVKNN